MTSSTTTIKAVKNGTATEPAEARARRRRTAREGGQGSLISLA